MATYAYSAMTSDGRHVRGQLVAASELAALDQLANMGMTPVSLSDSGDALPWWRRDISLTGRGALPPSEVLQFFTTLSTMLSARFSLVEALQFCQTQARKPASRLVTQSVLQSVQNGQALAIALENCRPTFPARLIALVAAGESANALGDVAISITRSLTDEQKLRRDLQAALIYPALLALMSLLVIGLLVFYLAPTLQPVFQSSGVTPPFVIRAMASVRAFVVDAWPLLAVSLFAIMLLAVLLRRQAVRLAHVVLLRLPMIGTHLRQREALRVLSAMRMMLACGQGLLAAIRAARDTAVTPLFKSLFAEAEDRLLAGGTLSSVLDGSTAFDSMTRMLLTSGEQSNRLPDLTDRACTNLAASTAQSLSSMVAVLTPLLTLFLGLFVGGIVLSTLSAVLQLNDIAF
jgi:type II secretory pathway component PulF